jgi:hypothetical protein
MQEEMMRSEVPQLRTAGVIADELGAPLSRVLYLLRKLRVRPIGRTGILRVYSQEGVEVVREALRQMDQKQGVTSGR